MWLDTKCILFDGMCTLRVQVRNSFGRLQA
jgi:hypothetical protein